MEEGGFGERNGRLGFEEKKHKNKKSEGKGRGGTAPGNNPGVETPGDRKSKTGEGK